MNIDKGYHLVLTLLLQIRLIFLKQRFSNNLYFCNFKHTNLQKSITLSFSIDYMSNILTHRRLPEFDLNGVTSQNHILLDCPLYQRQGMNMDISQISKEFLDRSCSFHLLMKFLCNQSLELIILVQP